MQVTQEEYMRAVNSDVWRPAFLDRIDLEKDLPYVSELLYIPDTDDIIRVNSVAKTFPSFRWFFHISGCKSRIEVYDNAFSLDIHQNVGDFLSSIVDHEGFHAYEFSKGSWRSIVADCERRAMDNQIQNFSRRDISRTYMELFTETYIRINSINPKID